ncbi:receptor-type tyrosine-protein phosphatase epsilon [Magallana gigas]|uniref:receptor-type tyrosine-protein phosphatase epsilon n=1 Tax=Magallana gigas TaxID=29159 RepID=UPI0033418456
MKIRTVWLNWTFFTFIVTSGYDNLALNKNTNQTNVATSCAACVAKNAVDGKISTCMRTEAIGLTTNNQHETWWYVDLGGVFNLYNIRIQFRNDYGMEFTMRQRGRFAGFSLYVSNTTDRRTGYLCYHNKDELPPLDFNINCISHGRFVIFYNERKGGAYPDGSQTSSVFTELCEVTVKGCVGLDVYGSTCDKPCTEHCPEPRCNISNGACYSCAPGWKGDFCKQACSSGYYGKKCITKCDGHCYENKPCNHISGFCGNGCLDGWTGVKCNQPCPPGKYGPGCINSCACFNNATCNITTGKCDAGCELGYTGDKCNKSCENLADCKSPCNGHCFNNDPCNTTNGLCSSGCAPGYVGTFCNRTCGLGTFGLNCMQNCSSLCNDSICHHINGSCNEKTVTPLKAVPTSNTGAIAGGVIGTVVVLSVLFGILYFRWRQNKSKMSDTLTKTVEFSNMDETLIKSKRKRADKNGNHNIPHSEETTQKIERKSKTSKSPVIETLTKALNGTHSKKMEEEYKAIPRGELHPCVEGKRQENLSKNRYTTIFPYDHSRVILASSRNESDYINANYIEDVFGKKAYIATQGPKKSTIVDFWRMVWQEKTRIIVCFTNINEASTKKIAKYWPDHNDTKQNGDITIRCQSEKIYAEHILRHLRVHTSVDKTERDVFMFHYTQWPDHGVPEPLSLVVFHRHVMKTAQDHQIGYIVVHCSGGTGRTGTFIALDAVYKEGERTGKVNVQQYVEKMRNARMNMIQAEDQYKLLYIALLESFRGRSHTILSEKFLQEFQNSYSDNRLRDTGNKSPIVVEFEELSSIKKEYTQEDYKSGRANISTNYVPSVLPVECYLCSLTNTKNKNTYYNAISLQSFTIPDRFISAQFPLPDYSEDFLRLVEAYYTPTIVSLCPLIEVESTSLWLPTKHESKTVGSFITSISEKSKTKSIGRTNITLQHKGGGSMPVTILECRQWNENEIENASILVDLIQDTKKEEMAYPDGRILVLSSDGAKRCGPFCAVFNALEQMMMDEEVDLFTITRQLQTRRPEFLSSLEEYQLCYGAVAEYLQNDSVYANA